MTFQLQPERVRVPLIVLRRPYFDEFAAGQKSIEFRRHRPPFTVRVFYPGRRVRISYRYDLGAPRLDAVVIAFETRPLGELPEMAGFYDGLGPDDLIALIHLRIDAVPDPAPAP